MRRGSRYGFHQSRTGRRYHLIASCIRYTIKEHMPEGD